MKVTFFVTQRDIDHGTKGDREKCAIARAVQRRLKADFFAIVSGYGAISIQYIKNRPAWQRSLKSGPIVPRDSHEVWKSDIDEKRERFISLFDRTIRSEQPKPFQFTLEIPDHLGWVLAK